jgi:membrane protease YdiL (CAAX protease family)
MFPILTIVVKAIINYSLLIINCRLHLLARHCGRNGKFTPDISSGQKQQLIIMSYFKKVNPFLQFLMFIGMAFGIFFIIGTVGTLILSSITGFSLSTIADPKNWDYNDPNTLLVARGLSIIQFIGLFLIPTFLFARFCDSKPGQYLGLRSATPLYFILGTVVLIVALPFVNWSGIINNALIPESTAIGKWMKASEEATNKQIEFLLKRRTVQDLLANLVFVALFAGIGEELFFRGVLQRLFIKLFKNAWAGILVAAFIFSAIHFQFYGFIPRFILGILLGLIYWYSGSIWPAIVAHFAYDAFAVIMIYFNPAMADNETVSISLGNQAVMAALSASLVISIVIFMKKRSTTTFEEMYARDKIDESNPFAV